MDISGWDGTLSSSDFCIAASAFSEKWERFNPDVPPWLWVPCPKRHFLSSHEVGPVNRIFDPQLRPSVLINFPGPLPLFICIPHSSSCYVCHRGKDIYNWRISAMSNQEELGKATPTQKDESDLSNKEECFDYATLVCSEQQREVNHYDFHIVYSASYRVPVLYFRAYHSDGQPLLFNGIEKDLPGNSAKLLSESKWTFITQELGIWGNVDSDLGSLIFQEIPRPVVLCSRMCTRDYYSLMQEHPYLNRPWYKLHPCGTGEWMKLLFLGDPLLTKNGLLIEQYLVSWFSVVGQVVGLKLPLRMLDSILTTYFCTDDEKNGNTE